MKQKLEELRQELAKGQHHLDLLDQQRQQVRDTLLRISGAIQVLEELLQAESSPNGDDTAVIPGSLGARAQPAARIST
jgi:prefoldin subunit 5